MHMGLILVNLEFYFHEYFSSVTTSIAWFSVSLSIN